MKMPRAVSIIEGMLEGEAYGLMTQMLFKQGVTISRAIVDSPSR